MKFQGRVQKKASSNEWLHNNRLCGCFRKCYFNPDFWDGAIFALSTLFLLCRKDVKCQDPSRSLWLNLCFADLRGIPCVLVFLLDCSAHCAVRSIGFSTPCVNLGFNDDADYWFWCLFALFLPLFYIKLEPPLCFIYMAVLISYYLYRLRNKFTSIVFLATDIPYVLSLQMARFWWIFVVVCLIRYFCVFLIWFYNKLLLPFTSI